MNVLIVGYGNFGKKYLSMLNQLELQFNLFILRHKKTEDEIDSKFNIKKVLYNIKETDKYFFKLVIITNPSNFHVETANYFIKKNIHCLIEKPLGNNFNVGNELIRNNNCCIHVGYFLEYSKAYKYLKNYEKYIGNLLLVKMSVGQYLPDWRNIDYKNCVSSSKEKGGGVLLELSHDIHYILSVLQIKEYKIKSMAGKISNLDINVEDYCYLLIDLKLKSEKSVKLNISIDMIDHNKNRTCKLIGEKGTLEIDFFKGTVEFYSRNNQYQLLEDFEENNLLKNQFLDFLKKINEKNFNNNTLEDSLLTLKIIDEIKNQNNI